MHIILNNSSMIPIYEQLTDQIKNLILGGDLQEHDSLPSVRVLSAQLKISALTVKKSLRPSGGRRLCGDHSW